MAVTLTLNQFETEVISLDARSESWLQVAHRNAKKNRMVAVPDQYFEVLKTRGLLEGTPGNAKITARGNSYVIAEEQRAKAEKKPKKSKKK